MRLQTQERDPDIKRPVAANLVSQRPAGPPANSPLFEIQLIEDEWRHRIQPAGLVEETLCAQLAHATWHLRCLHRAERESIEAAARSRSFNGESALSLMTWRISAESAVKNALDQLHSYRVMEQATLGRDSAPPLHLDIEEDEIARRIERNDHHGRGALNHCHLLRPS